jgi:hypothetical protein
MDPFLKPILTYLFNASDAQISEQFSRKFGEGGVRQYADTLLDLIHSVHPDFGNVEYLTRREERSQERTASTNARVLALTQAMTDTAIRMLKQIHGESREKSGAPTFWEVGVGAAKVRTDAYERQQQDKPESRGPIENYLDLIDLRDIAKQKSNWPEFKKIFDIALPGQKGQAYNLDWLVKINEIRRVAAHPTSTRFYTDADLNMIEHIDKNFRARLAAWDAENEISS